MRKPGWWLAAIVFSAIVAEIARVYFIMPFPGSQRADSLALAWTIHQALPWLRVVLVAAGGFALWRLWRSGGRWQRALGLLGVVAALTVAWQTNRVMSADAMFRQPRELRFLPVAASSLPASTLVLGVALGGEARAYPIRLIDYHHQVRDRVGGDEVMVTYCTVCRTGRVFRPEVDGHLESFRLVGMDRWNAMFEDATTGSWWRQATGQAVTGPRRGQALAEIPSRQMTLAAWSRLHPETLVMEPDPHFAADYGHLEGFEEGTRPSRLTGRDPRSWQDKSWVVGLLVGDTARAYDWNQLTAEGLLLDELGGVPVALHLAADGASFYAFERRLGSGNPPLELVRAEAGAPGPLLDRSSGSCFDESGLGVSGPHAGRRLPPVAAYQEFWHSWRTFRPRTDRFG